MRLALSRARHPGFNCPSSWQIKCWLSHYQIITWIYHLWNKTVLLHLSLAGGALLCLLSQLDVMHVFAGNISKEIKHRNTPAQTLPDTEVLCKTFQCHLQQRRRFIFPAVKLLKSDTSWSVGVGYDPLRVWFLWAEALLWWCLQQVSHFWAFWLQLEAPNIYSQCAECKSIRHSSLKEGDICALPEVWGERVFTCCWKYPAQEPASAMQLSAPAYYLWAKKPKFKCLSWFASQSPGLLPLTWRCA